MRTERAERVIAKAKAILADHEAGKPVDGLHLAWARMILAANSITTTEKAA